MSKRKASRRRVELSTVSCSWTQQGTCHMITSAPGEAETVRVRRAARCAFAVCLLRAFAVAACVRRTARLSSVRVWRRLAWA